MAPDKIKKRDRLQVKSNRLEKVREFGKIALFNKFKLTGRKLNPLKTLLLNITTKYFTMSTGSFWLPKNLCLFMVIFI